MSHFVLTPEQLAQWPEPNYVDPVERKWLLAVQISTYSVATFITFIRLFMRAHSWAGGLGLDDLFIFIAWLGYTGFIIGGFYEVKYCICRHTWDIPEDQMHHFVKSFYIAVYFYLFGIGCAKISILFFYRRLTAGIDHYKWFSVVAIWFTGLWTVGLMLVTVFECNPPWSAYQQYNPNWHGEFHCTKTPGVWITLGFAIVSDIYAIFFPCWVMWRLQMSRMRRIGWTLLFSSGILVVVAACFRTYYIWLATISLDPIWHIFNQSVATYIEFGLAFLLASFPTASLAYKSFLRPGISRLTSATRSSRPHLSGPTARSTPNISEKPSWPSVTNSTWENDVSGHSTMVQSAAPWPKSHAVASASEITADDRRDPCTAEESWNAAPEVEK